MADGGAPKAAVPAATLTTTAEATPAVARATRKRRPKSAPSPGVWLCRREAAALLGVSEDTIKRREREGALPAYSDGRMTRYLRADVMALMQPKTDMHRLAHRATHALSSTAGELVAVASVDGVPSPNGGSDG